jgi:hypothetical protein
MRIKIDGDSNIKLSQIREQCAGAPQERHIRYANKKSLHVHGRYRASMIDFFAFFGLEKAEKEREVQRKNGAIWVKTAIDREFGHGIGDKVFQDMKTDGQIIYAKCVRVQDLANIQDIARKLVFKEQAERCGIDVRGWSEEKTKLFAEILSEKLAALGDDASQEQKNRVGKLVLNLAELNGEGKVFPADERNVREIVSHFMPDGKYETADDAFIDDVVARTKVKMDTYSTPLQSSLQAALADIEKEKRNATKA